MAGVWETRVNDTSWFVEHEVHAVHRLGAERLVATYLEVGLGVGVGACLVILDDLEAGAFYSISR